MKLKSNTNNIEHEYNKIIQDFMGWKIVCINPNQKIEEGEDEIYYMYNFKQYNDDGIVINYSSSSDESDYEPWFKDDVIDFKEWTELYNVIEKLEDLGYAMTIDPWTIEMIEYRSGNEDSLLIFEIDRESSKLEWYYNFIVHFLEIRKSKNFIEKYEK